MGENYESSSSVEISSEISSESEIGEVSENIEIGNEISESEESYDDYSDCVEELTEDEGDSEVPEPAEAYDDYSDCVEEAEETGQKELEEGCLEAVPDERRAVVYKKFNGAPEEVKGIVNENGERLKVGDTVEDDVSHYNLETKIINMEAVLDDDEYAEVFSHEYGHFIDDMKGGFSETEEFKSALEKDMAYYDKSTSEGLSRFDAMLEGLFESDAAYDRTISDNLSAVFQNDTEIMDEYENRGISYYYHTNDYWKSENNREAEIYANSFSMYTSGTKESCDFMEKYFPNTWDSFKSSLKKEGDKK